MERNPVPRRNAETPEAGDDLCRSSFDIGVGQRCAAGDDRRRQEAAAETGGERVVEVQLFVDEAMVLRTLAPARPERSRGRGYRELRS